MHIYIHIYIYVHSPICVYSNRGLGLLQLVLQDYGFSERAFMIWVSHQESFATFCGLARANGVEHMPKMQNLRSHRSFCKKSPSVASGGKTVRRIP